MTTLQDEVYLRHNRRATGPFFHWVSFVLSAWLLAPAAALLVWVFFRVRSTFMGRSLRIAFPGKDPDYGGRAIFAVQHYYELDPVLCYLGGMWPYTILRPGFFPRSTAGSFWARNSLTRALALLAGVILIVPGAEPEGGALGLMARLLKIRRRYAAIIFPTGPIGKRSRYFLQRGVGWLAIECPDIPVIPIAISGVQSLRLRDVLLFRRPVIHVRGDALFYGRDIAGATREEREFAVCGEIARHWKVMENA